MASPATHSRVSSPGGDLSLKPSFDPETSSPLQLTPRSKVKALLAELDNDSEEDTAPSAARKPTISSPSEARTAAVSGTKYERVDGDAVDEEVDAIVAHPRGRMAARMQIQMQPVLGRGHKEGSPVESNSYENIRKQITSGGTRASMSDRRSESPSTSLQGSSRMSAGQQTPETQGFLPPSSSPGLFLTPEPPSPLARKTHQPVPSEDDSDSDLPDKPQTNARFLALVARKKEARLAKEATERQRQKDREQRINARTGDSLEQGASTRPGVMEQDIDDEDVTQQNLVQHVRPTRKAGKKAMEELQRETQRMSRNMQLAHEARTKKKIPKESLFAKFNFKPNSVDAVIETMPPGQVDRSSSDSSVTSEADPSHEKDTPPTSPPHHEEHHERSLKAYATATYPTGNTSATRFADDQPSAEVPDLKDVLAQSTVKGKEKAPALRASSLNVEQQQKKGPGTSRRFPSIHLSRPRQSSCADSDSDLEILPTSKVKGVALLDNLPRQQARNSDSMHALRTLANLTSPSRQTKGKRSMTLAQLHLTLQQRARQQAAHEREARLQELRNRGIVVQSAEERERDQVDVEDILEKARKEAVEIKKREKEASRKEDTANGGRNALVDSEDDEDWDGSDNESDVELSNEAGDEDEDDDEDNEENDMKIDEEVGSDDDVNEEIQNDASRERADLNPFVNEEAMENATDDEVEEHDLEEPEPVQPRVRSKPRQHPVISDDEDEDNAHISSNKSAGDSAVKSTSILPVFGGIEKAPMSLTQMFAGTMAESQSQVEHAAREGPILDEEQDSLALLRQGPHLGSLMDFQRFVDDGSHDIIRDSQGGSSQDQSGPSQGASNLPDIELNYSQSQVYRDNDDDPASIGRLAATQYSELPDPTQDVGIQHPPDRNPYDGIPPSTVDTLLLSHRDNESHSKGRRRLQRRIRTVSVSSSEKENAGPEETVMSSDEDGFEISANAFDVMRTASKRSIAQHEAFDKEKSKAKDMVEEQAEESEDEYAGLGGASDDDLGGEDHEVQEMINDEEKVNVDERKLASFYANQQRTNDAKQVEKLFKDITNGTLRRKRGVDYSLSDSEDDGEARQRRKRREFAKMRKALLEDENIGKIATNPRKSAFLRAIEDHDDSDMDFLDKSGDLSPEAMDSQENSNSQASLSEPSRRPKRLHGELETSDEKEPSSKHRRTQKTRKPASLTEIRDSVSFLIEDPNESNNANAEPSDAEDDERIEQVGLSAGRDKSDFVIDRISQQRNNPAQADSTNSKLAFHNTSTLSHLMPGFRVQSLLRKSAVQLSNKSNTMTSSTGVSIGAQRSVGNDASDIVKRGGLKKSSINYQSREMQRSVKFEESKRRKERGRMKVADERKGVLDVFGAGRFD
ncbi:MAG: hypothetical protein M1819_003568 [Sarea resinae]|nr:MAG: hypothetical protein M1819_003568 [Sarea resinae]